MAKLSKLEKKLYDALKDASEHLDYCGYGDKWERECAKVDRLEQRIAEALKEAEDVQAVN